MKTTTLSKSSLQSKILAIEMELSLIDNDLDVLRLDIIFFNNLLNDLVYNYNFLRKEAIIVKIHEYKRTAMELGVVESKILKLNNNIDLVNKKAKRRMKELNILYNELEIESKVDNVIYFKKRDKSFE